jgi:predicted DNA-binding protein (MmcQ/YjbR family)
MDAPRLKRLSQICLELPETTREPWGKHAKFFVRKRTFAWLLDNHHGDGRLGLITKTAPGHNARLVELDEARYYMPAYLHHQGWVGLRLDVGRVDWDEVGGLVLESYLLVAPKRLAAQVLAPPG